MSIGHRLFNIANAAIGKKREEVEEFFRKDGSPQAKESDAYEQYFSSSRYSPKSDSNQGEDSLHPDEDLSIFNLSPGVDWNTVKNAYRRECKKYHSDLHQKDLEKKEAAEQIMVILNSAYERLKKRYGKK